MYESVIVNLIFKLEEAFKNKSPPAVLTDSKQLNSEERSELMSFSGKDWTQIDCSLLEKNFEAINWFSPQAFCFFLPGFCIAGVKENRTDLLVYNSIIQMLDRSPTPIYWDTFFVERWALLNPLQCEAIQEWVLWLSEHDKGFYDDVTIGRAFDTLELLKSGVTALR